MSDTGPEQRALFRRWPAGVSVVVAEVDGRRARAHGLVARLALARAAARRDLDRALDASLHELLRDAETWAVSSSRASRTQLAQHFARSVPPIALWDGIDVREDDPRLLAGAAGWLIARTVDTLVTGDHTFFVGRGRVGRRRAAADDARLRVPRRTTRCDRGGRLRSRRRDRRLRAGVGRGARGVRPRDGRHVHRPSRRAT